jgi:hypothetical protein
MVPARLLNDMFAQRVATPEGREKIAQYTGTFIRDRLREVSFARKILPPEQVTRADCQVSVNHDTLVKIVWLEPKSRAMTLSFRGQPTARFIRGTKAEAAFFTISSEMFQKNEQELLAYDIPVTKIIEDNSVKDLQEIEDRELTIHVEAACQALQKEANGGTATALTKTTVQAGTVVEFAIRKGELARAATTNDAVVRPIQKPDLVNLFKMLDSNRLRAERVLITEGDYDDFLSWTVEDIGDKMASETLVDGYKYNTIMGRALIRTIKTDILRSGNVYCFAAPEFFGKFFILNNTKFYIDKVANMVTFQAWEDVSIAIVNVAAVRKLELYSADANPETDTQSLLSTFVPVGEESLGALNNRVDAGLKFPNISTY